MAPTSDCHGHPFSSHKEDDRLSVDVLEAVQEIERFLLGRAFVVVESLLDERSAKERREHAGYNKGDAKSDGHGEREGNDELTGGTREDEQRQKRTDDGHRRRKNRDKNFRGRAPRRLRYRHLMIKEFHIVVCDDDGVVDHDTEDDDQRCNRYLV